MRTPIMAANWKMQKTADETAAFLAGFLPLVETTADVEIVIAPPFTSLDRASQQLRNASVHLSAQNVSNEEKGAFTGEISVSMLQEFSCTYTIVGHSERRGLYGETDTLISQKAAMLLSHEILPIVCVGETLEEREADRTFDVLRTQLSGSLAGVPAERVPEIVIAYEPVWAIGTGKTATPEIAQEAHAFIRRELVASWGESGQQTRIQYGGSVKPENVFDLMKCPDIDGALVGGASLEPDSFSKIVHFEQQGGE
ncbi:triose-phosphate isomerase [Myxococcota bacterium]|nr:triose-phosphate isomerase [Myxococcota bacterium]